MFIKAVKRAKQRFSGDANVPLKVLVAKGLEFTCSMATSPLWLRSVDRVGKGVRTIGRPRIENFGYMEIADGAVLRSTLVPMELNTGVGARLTIGRGTFINYGASIGAAGEITIGNYVNIGPYAMVFDTTFHDPYDRSRVPKPKAVAIGDYVFLGAKCSVMPGVTIGEGAIVATGAVVTRDVAPFHVVAGTPAKVVQVLDASKFVRRNA